MNAERPVYVFRAERDGEWWFAKSSHAPGLYTQAATLHELDGMARDVVVQMLDVPPDSFDVRFFWRWQDIRREV